jgi:ATP-binding cassette subfamily B protein
VNVGPVSLQAPPPLTQRFVAGVRGSFAHTPRTMRLVWRSSRTTALVLLVFTVAVAVVPLGIAYVGKATMDAVVARARDISLLWVLVELGLIALQALFTRVLALARQTLGARLSIDINHSILEKAQTLELAHFEDPEFYDQLTRARREASSRPLSVVTGLLQLGQNAITLAGYIVVLVKWSPLAVFALIVAGIPATLVEVRYSNQAFRLRNHRAPENRRVSYLEHVLANDKHAKEVKALGLGRLLLDRYKELSETFYEEDRRLAVRRAAWGFAVALLGTLTFYGSYVVMAVAAAEGRITLGTMVLYVMAFRQGQQAFQAILGAIGGMYEDSLYMSNLFSYLDLDTRPAAAPARARANGAPAPVVAAPVAAPATAGGIAFEHVGFRYPDSDRWALRDVSLRVPAGEKIALVGHNGAGKSTFIKLLTRLYEPTEGRILLDGKDLRDWDKDALRKRIGVVFQDYNQYQFDVTENVGLGSVEHMGDEARVERAIDLGGAREVVDALPRGRHAQLGRWFKDGVELSGGQWQKIALARAFMREEADILVLDEPTAALDAEAEHAVFERFKTLANGRTAILISHRFPTVRMADRILVLDAGRIVEQGTHRELLDGHGRYSHMFELQAHGYQ